MIAAISGHSHWALEDDDCDTAATLANEWLKAQGKQTKFGRELLKHLPAIAFISFMAGLLGPRMQLSYAAVVEAKKGHHRRDGGPAGVERSADGAAGMPPVDATGAAENGARRTSHGTALFEASRVSLTS